MAEPGAVIPMFDSGIERAFVSALIHGYPDQHGVDLTHIVDPQAHAAFMAWANQRSSGLPVNADTVRARLELETLRKSDDGIDARQFDWYDRMTRTKPLPGAPVAGWARTILRFSETRASLLKAEDDAKRADDEVTDFALRDAEPPPEPTPAEYGMLAAAATDFDRNDKGQIYHSQRNIRLALAKLGVELKHNLFSHRDHISGLPDCGPAFDRAARNRLRLRIDEEFKFRLAKELFTDVMANEAWNRRFHPVRDYLASLKHDGAPRLGGPSHPSWLTTYAGAKDTPYTRAVGRLILVAACRRVRQPGCKFDEMVILESDMGRNKSSALEALAVRKEWFCDDLPIHGETKELMEATTGKWIVVSEELKGLGKADYNKIKSYVSRTSDSARAAYAEVSESELRQFVLWGTCNPDGLGYLKDPTGNRKFWPVRIDGFDLEDLIRDRDQLWAEAAAAEAMGESIRLAPTLYAAAAEEQNGRQEVTAIETAIDEFLGDTTGCVKVSDVWKILCIQNRPLNQAEVTAVGHAMRRLGWSEPTRYMVRGCRVNYYTKGDGKRFFAIDHCQGTLSINTNHSW